MLQVVSHGQKTLQVHVVTATHRQKTLQEVTHRWKTLRVVTHCHKDVTASYTPSERLNK